MNRRAPISGLSDNGHADPRVAAGLTHTPPRGSGIEALQRDAGNRVVVELLRAGQARLEVGASDDPFEREADAVARQVVRSLRSGTGSTTPSDDDASPAIRRRSVIGAEGGTLDPETESAITAARGGGAPLPDGVRTSMEGAFGGVDLGGVRVHSGPGSAALNRAVSAEAFTIGSDIFFSKGVPDATSPAGQELLAHELAHTVQQGAVHRSRS